MTFKRIIKGLWRALRYPLYRQHVIGRIRLKIDEGTFYSWLWRGIQRRVWPLNALAVQPHAKHPTADVARDYIQALRFNQAPHPEFHLSRTRVAPSSNDLLGSAPRFIAYYLPQFHPFEVNNNAWGEGFTEWTNTTKAVPQYQGHYQPHLPADLGHYDLRVPDVMRKQIDMAKSYGVHGFCFHYYWFDGQKVMDLPLNQFLAHPDMDQSFCICWANEHWTRRWDGMESEIILHQSYSLQKCIDFIHDILPILQDPRYILIEGKPLLVIYRPLLIPDLDKVVQAWRHEVAKAGLPGLWLVCAQTFGLVDPRPLGFDAAVEFPPHKINDRIEDVPPHGLWNPDFQGKTWQYADAVGEAMTRDVQPYPLYRCAFPSWDNEARRPAAGFSFTKVSPPQFGEWLATCASYARETRSPADNFVFINAWNEWAEGAHLEPDRHFGYAWLEQVARQAEKPSFSQVPRLDYGVPITPSVSSARIAVVAHIYYEETCPDIAQALQALQEPFDLLITTTPDKLALITALVTPQFAQAEIHAVDNKGRDIRPFIAVLPLLLERQYQAVLKLHSKKSLHRGDGDLWRQTLITQLLPSGSELPHMINSLHEYPALGLIAPQGNVLNVQRYIGSNQAWVEKLVFELGESASWLKQTQPWFAAGTMFWFKPQSVQSLLHCPSIQQDAFETEKGQIDGTLAHAVERVLGCATLANGYHVIDTRLAKGIGSPDAKIRRQAQKDWSNEWSYKGRQRTVDSPFARPTETAS
jgi:lipopolysaccharide biosynthesis protein